VTTTETTDEFLFGTETPTSGEQDLSAKLDSANTAIVGSEPGMETPPSGSVKLSLGLLRPDKAHRDATVRELTGEDEEYIVRHEDDLNLFVDAVLVRGVTRIGDIELEGASNEERQSVLRSLLLGDREALLLGVIAATYGNHKTLSFKCPVPSCGTSTEADIDLSKDFPVKLPEDGKMMGLTYTTSSGRVVGYELLNGHNQLEILQQKGLSVAGQNTLMLSRSITSVDGAPVVDPEGFARSLGMKDRTLLVQDMLDRQPRPDTRFSMKCPGCGFMMEQEVRIADIFRP
jgi:hypothetical protein